MKNRFLLSMACIVLGTSIAFCDNEDSGNDKQKFRKTAEEWEKGKSW